MRVDQKELTPKEFGEAVVAVAKANDLNFNILKVIEEMAETQELLIKAITKPSPFLDENMENIVEELGDLAARAEVLMYQLKIKPAVMSRTDSKLFFLAQNMEKKGGTSVTINRGKY